MRIYLVGFMATGKTTLGKKVAELLKVTFLDTDLMIESQVDMDINGIFATQGEEEFRAVEADILRQTTIYEQALVATGGGLPCFYENMQWMNDHGITMHLAWPESKLMANLLAQKSSRPLLADLTPEEAKNKISLLLHERMSYYEMSAITIELSGTIEEDVKKLEKACKYIW